MKTKILSILFLIGISILLPKSVSAYTVGIWADTKGGNTTLGSDSRLMAAKNPVFLFYPGDICSSGPDQTCFDKWLAGYNSGGDLLSKTFPSRGNHDTSQSFWVSAFEVRDVGNRVGVTNWDELNADLTYSFDYQGAHYVAIDLTQGDANAMGTAQKSWLDSDLSKAESRGVTHSFLFFHGPIYPMGGHCCTNATAVTAIINNHPSVSAAFHGHEHNLAYSHVDKAKISNVTHEFEDFTSGGGGASIYSCQRGDWCMATFGFMTMDVNGKDFSVTAFKSDGSTLKSWNFSKGTNPTPGASTPTPTKSATATPTKTPTATPTKPGTPTPTPTSGGLVLTAAEVATHNTLQNCWMIVSGKVYNVTSYINSHPGGTNAILNFCGKDGTVAFQTKGRTGGSNHSSSAYSKLANYLIGTLGSTVPVNPTATPTPTKRPTSTPTVGAGTPTSTPTPISSGACVTGSSTFKNNQFATQNGQFNVSFVATPQKAAEDAVIGLSANQASVYGDLAATVRFYTNGKIEALNGGSYGSVNSISYVVGTPYTFRLEVDIPSHTFNAFVSAPGLSETQIAQNYQFRSSQSAINSLSYYVAKSASSADVFNVCSLSIDSGNSNPTPTTSSAANGDANGDGIVNDADYLIWLSNYQKSVSGKSNGDFDNNGVVDGVDYVIWLTTYETTSSSTPTPTTKLTPTITVGAGTPTPTKSPTATPTRASTATPTKSPTATPTKSSVPTPTMSSSAVTIPEKIEAEKYQSSTGTFSIIETTTASMWKKIGNIGSDKPTVTYLVNSPSDMSYTVYVATSSNNNTSPKTISMLVDGGTSVVGVANIENTGSMTTYKEIQIKGDAKLTAGVHRITLRLDQGGLYDLDYVRVLKAGIQ